jgi:two-component system chemotaxis response regulator CheY
MSEKRHPRAHGYGAALMTSRILAVDDSPSMRQLVRGTLTGAGYELTQRADGVEALEYAKEHGADLVLTDVNMPRMDGIALARELRALPEYQGIPILLLTTESTPELKKQAREAGVTGWIVKPFSPADLLASVKRAL